MATLYRTNNTQEEIQPANGTDFTLKEAQAVVGGYVEIAHLEDGRIMILNEEGKLEGLPVNLNATNLFLRGRDGYDEIVGDVLVCKDEEFR